MAEKPILFSTPMVQAIIAGRKTQTRRVMKPQPDSPLYKLPGRSEYFCGRSKENGYRDTALKSPVNPGDVLWVRECWRDTGVAAEPYAYRADEQHYMLVKENGVYLKVTYRYKPSIHMPRAAARIFLRVTDVRVERIQEISIADCVAEGIEEVYGMRSEIHNWYNELWDGLNAKRGYGWDANPHVWVYEFERIYPETKVVTA